MLSQNFPLKSTTKTIEEQEGKNRYLDSQGGGRGFKSLLLHHRNQGVTVKSRNPSFFFPATTSDTASASTLQEYVAHTNLRICRRPALWRNVQAYACDCTCFPRASARRTGEPLLCSRQEEIIPFVYNILNQ